MFKLKYYVSFVFVLCLVLSMSICAFADEITITANTDEIPKDSNTYIISEGVTVTTNKGTVKENNGTITNNYGTVDTNSGTVTTRLGGPRGRAAPLHRKAGLGGSGLRLRKMNPVHLHRQDVTLRASRVVPVVKIPLPVQETQETQV